MPEWPATAAKIANTSATPAIDAASGRAMTRWSAEASRTRLSRPSGIRSAVLPGELLDLGNVVLGHEAGAGADVAGTVHWREVVGVEPRLGLRVGLERGDHLGDVAGVLLLHDRQVRDREIALEVRLLIDRERHRAVFDPRRDLRRQIEGGHEDLALEPELGDR